VEEGLSALERGWIDADTFIRAMVLFRTGTFTDARNVWLDLAVLTGEQLDELAQRGTDPRTPRIGYAEPGDPHAAGARYIVEQALNEGGMGRIFVCVDRAMGRRVALKALRPELGAPEHVELLAREARVTGNLEHPSIIPVYDVGVSESARPFYVMRLVDQPSLEDVLGKLLRGDATITATWSLSRRLRTFVQVCQAVHYAHTRDVIHCDLKPANILLGAFGEVLVGDWGLAYARQEGSLTLGGTPAYMAPEQSTGSHEIDERTDVFALGAVLYHMVTLKPPYAGDTPSSVLFGRMEQSSPPLPSIAAPPDRPVPAELDEITMRAMALEPAARFPSAQALADAVDSFLEGTRDREQRQRRADLLVEQGDDLAARYHEALAERPKLATELAVLSFMIDPWEPLEQRRRVWDAEEEVEVFDAFQVRILQEAIGSYEQALVECPGHPAARRGLALLYADQVQGARERKSTMDRIYYEGLLRQYDDEGTLVRAGGRPGRLAVDIQGPVDEVVLATLEEQDHQMVTGSEQPLEPRGGDAVVVAPGSYILLLRAGEHRMRVPVLIRGDRETQVALDVDAAGKPADGETFIAGGAAALGQESPGATSRGVNDVHVPSFFIQTFPVTFGSYLQFVESVLAEAPGRATKLIPLAREGAPLWLASKRGLVPTLLHDELGLTADTWRNTPVFGIDADCARAYSEWWSRRTGRKYRLPTEHEWEKAARGVDGRRYPWGDRFEAVFCKMKLSRPGRSLPEPIGAFPSDVSPYGVRDLAGGVSDLCTLVTPGGTTTQFTSRGGAWCDADADDCATTSNRRVQADERSVRVGFRLVR
jgi:serine/threonine-protein kinase